jgi:hypothetical protein
MSNDNIQEVYDNDIDMYLKEFQEEQGIEDLRTASQNLWNAAMMYIQRHLFTDRNMLKQKSNIYDTNTIIPTNCNSYDYELLNNICDYYIYICSLYDKECSIWGYSKLLNIPYALIQEWGNNYKDSNRLSSLSSNIYKKLTDAREQSLVAKLMSMKHPTAIAIVLNKDYSYNLPGVSKEVGNKSALSVADLPKLGTPKLLQVQTQLPDADNT